MTSAKASASKVAANPVETTSIDNVISVAQWVETTAIAREGMFKCARDLAEISRIASQAVIGSCADYGNEVRDIGSICTAAVISGLTEAAHPSSGDGAVPVKADDGTPDMMKQVQRLMDANTRLAERQINAAFEAISALSALPSCILGSLDGN